MCVPFRDCAIAVAANCILLASLVGRQTTSPGDPSFKTQGGKSQKQQEKKAAKDELIALLVYSQSR